LSDVHGDGATLSAVSPNWQSQPPVGVVVKTKAEPYDYDKVKR
jgi:hypothetical protein